MPDPAPPAVRSEGAQFDLLVVGAGILGAAVARDAALRGLDVVLLDRGDVGGETSAASSKLVHGGLRYLEQLHLGLVRESLREREILLRLAPHLVRPLPFLMPLRRGEGPGPTKARLGLTLYDLLAWGTSLPRHRVVSAAQALDLEPRLEPDGLRGAALFHDAQMNDARLTLETALDARDLGATVLPRVEAVGLLEDAGRVRGVQARDVETGQDFSIEAALTVNAAGPWYGQLSGTQTLTRPRALRLSRGTHIVVPTLTGGRALLLQARADGRVFFVMPWKGCSLVGTTEVEVRRLPRSIQPTEEEIDYLLRELALHLKGDTPGRGDVLHSFAGIRALAGTETDPGAVSREESLAEEAPGLVGVFGGKYTTHRAIAERVVDLVANRLGATLPPCRTHLRPLPGGDIPDLNDYFRVAEKLLIREFDLEPPALRYLIATYGTRHPQLLNVLRETPRYREPLEPGLPFLVGEVVFAVRHEMARTLEDVLLRRTWRGFLGPLDTRAHDRWQQALEEAKAQARPTRLGSVPRQG